MNSNETKNPILVNNKQLLSEMAEDLKVQSMFGIDTESNSLFAYHEKVCLIQISTSQNDYILDPLAIDDLSCLSEIFKNNHIEKIFHAAEYDIMCLKRDFNFEFNNIFDTMLASRILGKKSVGLSFLLQDYFSVHVNKEFQKANWGKRPLTVEMLKYAIMDSHYLIKLRTLIKRELIDANLLQLADEDFLRTSNVAAFQNNQNGNNYWKLLKGNKITPREMAIFVEICDLRERLAEKANIPAFKIFSTNLILEITKVLPNDQHGLNNIKGFSPKLSQKYSILILDAIKVGLKNDPVFKPHRSKPDENYLNIYDALKTWRKKIAIKFKVESDVILPKEYIDKIASNNPENPQDLKELMIEIPYRFDHFGEGILQVLEKV